MAGSLNKVLLIGRLGADPEIKQMVNGKSVARLSLATSQSWKDKATGEKNGVAGFRYNCFQKHFVYPRKLNKEASMLKK